VRGLTAQEYVVGILLNNRSEMCTASNVPFNVSDAARRVERYGTSGILRNPTELLSASLRESLHVKQH